MTCPGRDAVLRYDLIGAHFYDISWSGRNFTTCPGRGADNVQGMQGGSPDPAILILEQPCK